MHLKRNHWRLAIGQFALMLQWFNPLVWFATKQHQYHIEAACDADVCRLLDQGKGSTNRDYAHTLIEVLQIRQQAPALRAVNTTKQRLRLIREQTTLGDALFNSLRRLRCCVFGS